VNRRVLIADGDAARAAEIASACSAAGLVPRVVHHGAKALEAALAEPPDVIVLQIDLPLIEGPRLEEILRANPRTHEVRSIFLADQEAQAERMDLGGQVVPPPCQPDLVVACVRTALGESATRVSADSAPGEGGVEGELSQLPLADLLQLFHVSRKTGTVEVTRGLGRTRRQVGKVSLRAGDVVDAVVDTVNGKKALFRLLGWDRGGFVFVPGVVEGKPSIQTPTRPLLREGLRQIREWEKLAVELPALSASVFLRIPRSSLPNVIHPLTQEVLVVLDLCSRVQDVVDQCTYPDYQVLRTLHTLIERGMVELQSEADAPELVRDVRLFSAARTARLREWLEVDRPGPAANHDAKLLVIASGAETLRAFATLIGRLPGVELSTALEQGEIGTDDLVPFARLAVDDEVGIELIHLPAAERFAPIWPLAGHDALATLMLLAGPVAPALAGVASAAAVLGAATPARLFHLLLLDKQERVSPEELRQHLEIVDDGSLFLLPLENTEKAGVLLREMFGRLLP
jgi:DNA-binding response OmpR family regulator